MKKLLLVLCVISAVILTSCYHATIETGLPASNKVIEKPWAHGFIFGLVPPNTINVAQECENGVAIVETQHSFLNGLVGAITYGIYTPMHITVTCASSSSMTFDDSNDNYVLIAKDLTEQEKIETMEYAVNKSVEKGEKYYVFFE